MKKLTKEQVIILHEILINFSGALNIQSKAARLAFGLIKNHPFVDGNKRIGILSMVSFLEVNGIKCICTDAELIDLGLRPADGSLEEKALLDFIIEHS